MQERLEIVVLGASGDLARKKTYPTLLELFAHGFLPKNSVVCGFARTANSDEKFRDYLRSILQTHKNAHTWPEGTEHIGAGESAGGGGEALETAASLETPLSSFLSRNFYCSGSYDSSESFAELHTKLIVTKTSTIPSNRLFYFAIPPNVFIPSARAIRNSAMSVDGWTRLIVEKPFGHDLASAQEMGAQLGSLFSEDHIYRIDHYLGKEMVQNLIMFRFGNTFLEPLMNNRYVHSIQITFKEDFGTQGRGGYFDQYGIMRDILQNHLMQVLSILAMEPPVQVAGPASANYVRDAKVNVLRAVDCVLPQDVVLGQYTADAEGVNEGYLQDPTVPKDSMTATFAQVVLRVKTPRWENVPFILKAGKALNERKAEIRIQFKDAPGSSFLFDGQTCARNELVLRLQPSEAVYLKMNVKKPGLTYEPLQSELDLTYNQRYAKEYNPDAYTRLVLDALRGNQAMFVRNDELEEAWRVFTPILHFIETEGNVTRQALKDPTRIVLRPYPYGSRGPAAAAQVLVDSGVKRYSAYVWEGKK